MKILILLRDGTLGKGLDNTLQPQEEGDLTLVVQWRTLEGCAYNANV